MSIQKFLLINLGVNSWGPFLGNIILFLLLIGGMNWVNWKALYSETYYKLQQNVLFPYVGHLWLGYILGQIILSVVYTDSGISILIIVCLSLLSLYTAFLSINIHRYFFIQKNMKIVKEMYPEFGLPKSERNTKSMRKKKKRN